MGLLDTKQQQQPVRGLLAAPQKAGLIDYALATAMGGIPGAAGLAYQQRQGKRQYEAQSQRYGALLDQATKAGWTPDELTALALDPEKALGLVADRVKPLGINGGDSALVGGRVITAPKVGVQDGYGYTQTPEGITWGAQRGMSHQELETERHNTQGETLEGDRNRETGRHNLAGEGIDLGQLAVSRGQLGVSQGQLGVSRANLAMSQKDATESQAKAAFNVGRMVNATRTLGALEKKLGYNPNFAGAGSFLQREDSRAYEQAAGQWVDALIRQTSGAVAGKDEIESYKKIYFGQPGDSPAIRRQKAESRAAEEALMARSGGRAVQSASPGQAAPASAAPADPLGIRR